MTARQLYENSLIELNKVQAPSLLLGDYNYFVNKAIVNYIDKKYNLFEINQQNTDDLRVLTSSVTISSLPFKSSGRLQGIAYLGALPQDYLHLLNCVAEFKLITTVGACLPISNKFYPVKRLTADMSASIINNYYLKPNYKNPYFYLHNAIEVVLDTAGLRQKNSRDGNTSSVNIEIHCGKDAKFVLDKIHVDYLKVHKYIELTQNEIDVLVDASQVLEFPDYVCYEIIKELTALLMENASDPRLNSNIPVNQSIASQSAQQFQKR